MQNSSSKLTDFYKTHHSEGNRYGGSVMEDKRAQLYNKWIPRGSKVVDLGGRDGQLTRHFIAGNHVTIADIDEVALETAKERYDVETQLVNLNESLPFDDNSFDVVTMSEVLEHLPYPKITLAEIVRIVRPGGLFICNFPLAYHLQDRIRVMTGSRLTMSKDSTHLQFLSFSDAKTLLSQYFMVEQIHILKGGKIANIFPNLFARNVAFKCKITKTD
ncbi:MAG: class I SAM-dependent methyltransferase [Chromatiales bacterium]|jgi:ubiquinone/menaquinone biosynthesis C-methylase UbiE